METFPQDSGPIMSPEREKDLVISHISHPRYKICQYIQDSSMTLNSSHQNLTRPNYLSCFEY